MGGLEQKLGKPRKSQRLRALREIIGEGWEWVYNHPVVSGLTAATAATASYWYRAAEEGDLTKIISAAVGTGAVFTATYLPLRSIGMHAGLKNLLKTFTVKFKGAGEEIKVREEIYRSAPELTHNLAKIIWICTFYEPDPDKANYYTWALAEQIRKGTKYRPGRFGEPPSRIFKTENEYLENKKIAEALEEHLQGDSEKIEEMIASIDTDNTDAMAIYRNLEETTRKVEAAEKSHDEKKKMAEALNEFFHGQPEKLIESLDTGEADETGLNGMLLSANLLGIAGRKKEAEERWNKLTIGALEILEWNFQKLGESRNEVFISEPDDILGFIETHYDLQKKLIFKRSQPGGSLKKEYETIKYFSRELGAKVAEPLAIGEYEEREYLVSKCTGNRTLASIISELIPRKRVKHLKEAARLLARIHAQAEKGEIGGELKLSDAAKENPDYYMCRIDEILFQYNEADVEIKIPDEDRELIRQNYDVITDRLIGLPTDYYKDHSLNNLVLSDFGEVVAIDFEGAKKLPCQVDLVTMLEFGDDYVTEGEKRNIIKAYLKEKRRLTGRKTDLDRFMEAYDYIAVHRHLELIGYKSRDVLKRLESGGAPRTITEELEKRRYHIKKAEQKIDGILERCTEDIERLKLLRIKTALLHTSIEVPEGLKVYIN